MPNGETLNLKLSNPYLIGVLAACVVGGVFKMPAADHCGEQGGFFLGFQWGFAMG